MIFLLENNIRGGISSFIGDRYVISDESKKILSIDAIKLYGQSMSQPLPYDKIDMLYGPLDLNMNKLEEVSNTPDDADIGYFIEVEIKYPDNLKKNKKLSILSRR